MHIHVNPPADVEVVQTEITALLSLRSPLNFLNLSVQGNDIVVLPVGEYTLHSLLTNTHACKITFFCTLVHYWISLKYNNV